MKTLSAWFRINRALGPAILSIALIGGLLAFASSARHATTKLNSAATAVSAAPACTASTIFSASFTGGQDASTEVQQQWRDFIQNLTPSGYDTVTISGSNDTVGRTLTDATIVPQIAAAMQHGTGGSWNAGGFTWNVGIGCQHGNDVELNANDAGDATTCNCQNPGYVVRPDISPGNSNWGGVNTATCGTPSQTITVTFSGPAAPSCATPPSGMISWWPAEGDANDIQGSNDGTLENGATFTPGEVRQGFSLNGTDQYIEVPDSAALNITGPITIDAWINTNANTGQQSIVEKYASSGTNGYFLRVNGGGLEAGVCQASSCGVSGGGNVTTGTFHHVAVVFDGASVKLYLDGVQVIGSTGAGSIAPTSTSTLNIGARGGSANFFNGIIDEVEIFNRALTGAEVLSIYNAQCTGKCRSCASAPGSMVSWWKAEGNTTDSQDSNNGTFNGTPVYGAGEVGQAFSFDGSSWVQVPDATNLHFAAQFTLDAWVYSDLSGVPIIFSKFGESNFSYELHLQSDGSVRSNISGDGTSWPPQPAKPIHKVPRLYHANVPSIPTP